MVLALRKIVGGELPLPIRVGVNRGAAIAGDIGPHYWRACTVIGDAVDLAARLIAKAEPRSTKLRRELHGMELDHPEKEAGTLSLLPRSRRIRTCLARCDAGGQARRGRLYTMGDA